MSKSERPVIVKESAQLQEMVERLKTCRTWRQPRIMQMPFVQGTKVDLEIDGKTYVLHSGMMDYTPFIEALTPTPASEWALDHLKRCLAGPEFNPRQLPVHPVPPDALRIKVVKWTDVAK